MIGLKTRTFLFLHPRGSVITTTTSSADAAKPSTYIGSNRGLEARATIDPENLIEVLAIIRARDKYDVLALGLLHALYFLVEKCPKCSHVLIPIDSEYALYLLVVSL